MDRKRIIGLFFIIGLVLLIGCGKRVEREPVVQLAFWADRWNRALATELVNNYNQTNPPVKVSYLPVERYRYKLLTMIAGGIPPDIMLLDSLQVIDYSSRGILLELGELMREDMEFQELKKDIHEGLLEDGKYEDKIYGAPIWTNIIGLFYNKDLFDEEGIAYPDKNWDWQKLLESARLLTKDKDKNGRIDQFGLGGLEYTLGNTYGWDLYLLIRGNNLRLFSPDMERCLVEDPEVKGVIRWALELKTKYHIMPTERDMSTGQLGWGGGETFSTGRVAMYIGGRWFFRSYLDEPKFNWGVAPYPTMKKRAMTRGTILLGISKKTKYPEACWQFIKYVVSKEGQKYIIEGRSDTSILTSIGKTDAFLNYYSRPKENKLFVDGLLYSEKYPCFLRQEEWNAKTGDLLENVELGRISLDQACKRIAEKYREIGE